MDNIMKHITPVGLRLRYVANTNESSPHEVALALVRAATVSGMVCGAEIDGVWMYACGNTINPEEYAHDVVIEWLTLCNQFGIGGSFYDQAEAAVAAVNESGSHGA